MNLSPNSNQIRTSLKENTAEILLSKSINPTASSASKSISNKKITSNQPYCAFVNIELLDSMNVLQSSATILLENPVDKNSLNKADLIKLVSSWQMYQILMFSSFLI